MNFEIANYQLKHVYRFGVEEPKKKSILKISLQHITTSCLLAAGVAFSHRQNHEKWPPFLKRSSLLQIVHDKVFRI